MKRIPFRQVIQSIVASAFGVQSDQNKRRDFENGQPAHFIVAGCIATVLFIIGLIVVVRLVLHYTGG